MIDRSGLVLARYSGQQGGRTVGVVGKLEVDPAGVDVLFGWLLWVYGG